MSIQRVFRGSAQSAEQGEKCFSSQWALVDGPNVILTVEETSKGRKVCIRVAGNLRSDTTHFFGDELLALATSDSDVTLEMDALQMISNNCQKSLIKTQQMMDSLGRGTLTLTKLPKEIEQEFMKSGIAGALMIE